MPTPLLALYQDVDLSTLPSGFQPMGNTLNTPLLSLLVGLVLAAIVALTFVFRKETKNRTRNAFAYGIVAFVLATIVSLPLFGSLNKERFEVSGVVVNTSLNGHGANIGLDTTGRELLHVHGGPVPWMTDEVKMRCVLSKGDDARVFDCALVSLAESRDGWLHP